MFYSKLSRSDFTEGLLVCERDYEDLKQHTLAKQQKIHYNTNREVIR